MEAAGKRHILYGSRTDAFLIWNFADLHIGNRATLKKRLREDVKRVADDPFSFWIGGGDYAEFISTRDKRWAAGQVDPALTIGDLERLGDSLYGMVSDILWPIRDKCLALGFGNHEYKYMQSTDQQHLHRAMCTQFGVPSLAYAGLIDVVFVRTANRKEPKLVPVGGEVPQGDTYARRFFIFHGAGAAQTPGGKLGRLKKAWEAVEADVYMLGHLHDQLSKRFQRIGADRRCETLQHSDAIAVMTGSYLATYRQRSTTYGEMKGYSPCTLGATHVRIEPDKQKVTAET